MKKQKCDSGHLFSVANLYGRILDPGDQDVIIVVISFNGQKNLNDGINRCGNVIEKRLFD